MRGSRHLLNLRVIRYTHCKHRFNDDRTAKFISILGFGTHSLTNCWSVLRSNVRNTQEVFLLVVERMMLKELGLPYWHNSLLRATRHPTAGDTVPNWCNPTDNRRLVSPTVQFVQAHRYYCSHQRSQQHRSPVRQCQLHRP
jgi:hypothetical protein